MDALLLLTHQLGSSPLRAYRAFHQEEEISELSFSGKSLLPVIERQKAVEIKYQDIQKVALCIAENPRLGIDFSVGNKQ